jgi:DMSO/TMAO reductase YedYZ heme-binding membrane subunit
VLEQTSPDVNRFAKSTESPAWLLLPLGFLSLIIIIPLLIASVNWYRGYRAERALLRS